MAIQYHATVLGVGQDWPDSMVELSLDVERNKIHGFFTIFMDEQTLKDEGIAKGSKLIINLSKKLKY